MNRRTLLRVAALAPFAATRPVFAQERTPSGWPDRLVRIVVPFVPGSFTHGFPAKRAVTSSRALGWRLVPSIASPR